MLLLFYVSRMLLLKQLRQRFARSFSIFLFLIPINLHIAGPQTCLWTSWFSEGYYFSQKVIAHIVRCLVIALVLGV